MEAAGSTVAIGVVVVLNGKVAIVLEGATVSVVA
jgi:hypothetical protein